MLSRNLQIELESDLTVNLMVRHSGEPIVSMALAHTFTGIGSNGRKSGGLIILLPTEHVNGSIYLYIIRSFVNDKKDLVKANLVSTNTTNKAVGAEELSALYNNIDNG